MARLGAGVGLIALVRFSKKLTLNLSNWISMHTRSLIAKVPNPWNANKDWTLCTCMHLELAAIYVWNLEYFEFFCKCEIFDWHIVQSPQKEYWTSIASILLEKQYISNIRPYLEFGKKNPRPRDDICQWRHCQRQCKFFCQRCKGLQKHRNLQYRWKYKVHFILISTLKLLTY